MVEAVVGVDIAKKKFDVALFMNGKFKHKTCVNTRQGFEELSQWLKRQGVERVRVCMEATGTYGDDLATYMHDAGHTVSIVKILINLIVCPWTNGNKKPAISNGFLTSLDFLGLSFGGDEGDRTPDLGIANAALSQLSYIPTLTIPYHWGSQGCEAE